MISKLSAVAVALLLLAAPAAVHAGTTGSMRGRVVDSTTGAPLANARVAAVSPSQAAAAKTDANGEYVFISLAPDTYTISVQREGYASASLPGVTVFADNVAIENVELAPALRTIANVRSRESSSIVRPGQTQDVFSVNAPRAQAAATLGGGSSLNQSYGALASLPGVDYQQGQQGWGQQFLVRGSADVSDELDGVPIRGSLFSSLGQQEMQLYAGGAPASADATGTSGYINQVIRTGTYPGFASMEASLGWPSFYHKFAAEVGGATPDRLFSYYVGLSGWNQSVRFVDQNNGAGDPRFFFPFVIPTGNNGTVYDGSAAASFVSGIAPQQIQLFDRESIVNLHIGIPHKKSTLRDDVQLLYMDGYLPAYNATSVNDLGGAAWVTSNLGFYPVFPDDYVYNGALMTPINGSEQFTQYFAPHTPGNRAFQAPLPPSLRDDSVNEVSLVKAQFQHTFDERSFLRVYGYSNYFFLGYTGADSANLFYGPTPADYIIYSRTYGVTGRYENQLSARHLLTITATGARTGNSQLNDNSIGGSIVSNYVDAAGNCYAPSGAYDSCYGAGYNLVTQFGTPPSYVPSGCTLTPSGQCAESAPGSPALRNGAHWVFTENGYGGDVNAVTERDYGYSVADQWRPNDRLVLNAGLRMDKFAFDLPSTAGGPARAFWFAAFNREYCYAPGQPAPILKDPTQINQATGAWPACPPGYASPNLQNVTPASVSYTELEPRAGLTYTIDPDTVVRFSYGRYASSPGVLMEINTRQQDLPDFMSQFLPFGYTTPYHGVSPQIANSFDASFEKHIRGTDLSFRITPFYHLDLNALENIPIGYNGDTASVNAGQTRSYGVEAAFTKGDFVHNGLSMQLSYTYTNSKTHFSDITPGTNFVDVLNGFIEQYNSYTKTCASPSALCGPYGSANASPTLASTNPNAPPGTTVINPYYGSSAQPLLDRNAWYPTGAEMPAPFNGSIGQVYPNVLSVVLSYRHDKFAITPTAVFSQGKTYGSPLVWPGYLPQACLPAGGAASGAVDPTTCTAPSSVSPAYLFIPDQYTGRFDNWSSFKEPSRLTVNLGISYDVSPKLTLSAVATGLIDKCYQNGYPWDDSNFCVFDTLASSVPAVGNFVPLSSAPVQLRYPYGYQYNPLVNGFAGVKVPVNFFLSAHVKL